MYYNILKYSHQYTPSQAASFARFEAQNVLAVKNLVEEEGIDCDFVLTRAVDVYLDEEHSKATLENFGKLKEMGKAELGDVEVLEGREAEEVSLFFCFFLFFFFRFFFRFFVFSFLFFRSVGLLLPTYLREVMKMKRKKKKGKRDNPLSIFMISLFLSRENYTNPSSPPNPPVLKNPRRKILLLLPSSPSPSLQTRPPSPPQSNRPRRRKPPNSHPRHFHLRHTQPPPRLAAPRRKEKLFLLDHHNPSRSRTRSKSHFLHKCLYGRYCADVSRENYSC